MVPELMHTFEVNAGGLALLVAMYYYAYAPLQAIVGVLTDYFGPRRVMMSALVLCTLGAYLFGHTDHVAVASIGRFMVGAGSAFAFVGVLKLAAIWLPKNRFAIFAGLTTSLGMLGGMFGDIELTHWVRQWGWQSLLAVSVLAGCGLLLLFFLFVHDNGPFTVRQQKESLSLKALGMSLWKICRNKQLWLTGYIGLALYMSLTVIAELWGIPYLRALHPRAPMIAAQVNSMIFFGWLLGSPFMGWLSDRLRSRRLPLIVGTFVAGILMAAFLWCRPEATWLTSLWFFLFGFFSSAEILVFVIAREVVGTRLVATAIGFINLLVMLGGMLIQPLVGRLLDWGWQGEVQNGVHVYHAATYTHALIIVPVLMLLAGVMSFALKETYTFSKKHPKKHKRKK